MAVHGVQERVSPGAPGENEIETLRTFIDARPIRGLHDGNSRPVDRQVRKIGRRRCRWKRANKNWHSYAMQNIYMECDLSESCAKTVIDGFIGNNDWSILLKTNNKRIKNISLFYFSNIRYRNSFVFDLSAHIHDNKLRVSHAFIPQAFLCILWRWNTQ